jgi:nitrite reductase/ring-hydroxylating ferredoxin subunit
MTTGKVLGGPTQEWLKTAPVSVQDGKIVVGG